LANGLFRLLDSQLPTQLRHLFEQLCIEAITTNNNNVEQQQLNPVLNRNGNIAQQQNGCSEFVGGQQQQRRPLPQPLMELPLNGKWIY